MQEAYPVPYGGIRNPIGSLKLLTEESGLHFCPAMCAHSFLRKLRKKMQKKNILLGSETACTRNSRSCSSPCSKVHRLAAQLHDSNRAVGFRGYGVRLQLQWDLFLVKGSTYIACT